MKSRVDKCYIAADVLEGTRNNAKLRRLDEFIDDQGNINFQPDGLIFREDTSQQLKDSTSKPIQDWN